MGSIKTYGIKEGDVFVIMNPLGDIYPTEVSPDQGLYRDDTRFLSRLELRVEGMIPHLLSSTVKEDNVLFTADLTNPCLNKSCCRIEKDTIHIFRSRFIHGHVLHERIRLKNYNNQDVKLKLEIFFDADYFDIFQLRGVKRKKKGECLPVDVQNSRVVFSYRGADRVTRYTTINFSPQPEHLREKEAVFQVSLPPHGEYEIFISIAIGYGSDYAVLDYDRSFDITTNRIKSIICSTVQVHTSNEQFNDFLNRSRADICTLVTETPYGLYPYAGIPWYSTTFGRDGIITALECMWIAPDIARGVLRFLAAHQADSVDPDNDAEPGKIPHEIRKGEMARTGEVPFAHYYGSVDATPLFVILTGEYFRRTGDLETVVELWDNIRRALRWIKDYGDLDQDGFVEYQRHTEKGLVNQGWKDSHDSVFHSDGTLAKGPVALVEVQGFVYQAWNNANKLARIIGDDETVRMAQSMLRRLKSNFQRAFWSKKIGMYALALDGQNRPCEVRTSNAGYTLFTGIATKKAAKRIARTLLSDEFFTGWGIRTLSKQEVRYNPMSYHNGSVWPHDNALIALGLSRYGFKKEVLQILTGLFDASLFVELHRLPELFCGFERRPGEGPTLYPVACQPQAWASAAVFLILQAALGLSFESETNSIIFRNPTLPYYIDAVEIHNLTMLDSSVDLFLERYKDDVVVKVIKKEGDVNIVIYK